MKYLYIVILLIVLSVNSYSQNIFGADLFGAITYNTGFTANDSKDFVDEYSWLGAGIEIRNFLSKDHSVGASFSWNYFDDRTRDILEIKRGAISGTQLRYLGSLGLLLNTHYYMGTRSKQGQVIPFLGINVGTYYINQMLDIGVVSLDKSNWHFGLAPEFGFVIPAEGIYLITSFRYNYAFEAGESVAGEATYHSYWGINFGIAYERSRW
jgi:hypothetical protein